MVTFTLFLMGSFFFFILLACTCKEHCLHVLAL